MPGPLEARRRLDKRKMALASPGDTRQTSAWNTWRNILNWFLSGHWASTSRPYIVELRWEPPWALEDKRPVAATTVRKVSAAAAVLESSQLSEEFTLAQEEVAATPERLARCRTARELRELIMELHGREGSPSQLQILDVAERMVTLGASQLDIRAISALPQVGVLRSSDLIPLIERCAMVLSQAQYAAMLGIVRVANLDFGIQPAEAQLSILLELLRARERLASGHLRSIGLRGKTRRLSYLSNVWMALKLHLKRNNLVLGMDSFEALIAHLGPKTYGSSERGMLKLELFKYAWPLPEGTVQGTAQYFAHWMRLLLDAENEIKSNKFTLSHLKDAFGTLPGRDVLKITKYATLRLAKTSSSFDQLTYLLPRWFHILREIDGYNTPSGRISGFEFERTAFHALRRNFVEPQRTVSLLRAFSAVDAGRLALYACHRPYHRRIFWKKMLLDYQLYVSMPKPTRMAMAQHIAEILITMAAVRFRDTRLAQSILLRFILKAFGPGRLIILLRKLRFEKFDLKPSAVEDLLLMALREKNLKLVADIYNCTPVVLLREHERIISELIASGQVHSRTVFLMLKNCQPDTRVFVNPNTKAHTLTAERINLVNNMALLFAEQKGSPISPRVAFRNVWFCYSYFRANNAPISKEITEAFVTAGVIRPLQQDLWVSTTQFAWILGFVRDTEGDETAERLDKLTFEWRERVRLRHLEEGVARKARGERLVWKDFRHWIPHRSLGVIPTYPNGRPVRWHCLRYRRKVWERPGAASAQSEVVTLGHRPRRLLPMHYQEVATKQRPITK